ncbi:LRR receptor-like serine/threonine-protein kinase fls2 [Phtheirospermum japonicum]|uniref:LRR receptor-like serine/threonine-protein kinase fls2 n=1 Tax=Phtheirospermum japonicum TaxID=374723 RepID=A0A830D1W4_9LAMI|nr:LRR receptor-like serine/threonine-protein kinase fls2 [Phtheirospermum japonicum]
MSSWNVEVDCCKWKSVVCSNLTGHVLELHLQSYDLSRRLHGRINPSLLNLKHLKYVDLSHNNFEETIPSFIGSLTSLEYLDLSGNSLRNEISHSIGNLTSLHTLDLSYNQLSEETYLESFLNVDSLAWLSGLSKLEHLNMNYVNLSQAANWAQVINKLPSLVELRFSYCNLNDFTAPLNYILNITHSNLAILDLSAKNLHNLQSSEILRRIFQLDNLIFIDLSLNYFEGPIPTISNTTKLTHIDLSVNNFNSNIPEWLYSCKDLKFVSLSGNHLQNEISNSIANSTSLNTLDLSFNQLSGEIPRGIANLCRLQKLDLGDNKLHGEVSDAFGNMSDCFLRSLQFLYLYTNQLSGHLTQQFGEFKSLQDLDLTGNSLSENVGKLSNLIEFDISDNMLEGVVSETHFAHLSKLKFLYASRNHLIFNVSPNWIPPFKLEMLRLGSLNLGSGTQIPSWIETQKKTIWDLDLSCTGIYGNVPSWIRNVRSLNLSHNQLHGKIPLTSDGSYGVGPLPRVDNIVTELDLSNNSFSGDMSHFLCDTTYETYAVEILHLGGNYLCGELPDCFMKWPSLRVLNLGNNNLSGTIPNSIRFLGNLESLNLFGNKFSGQIPSSIQNCAQLLMMDLADNNLDGNISEWIGTRLSKLKFLILRSNMLSGEITSAICQLSSLQILDLSDNMFSGVIPRCVNNFTAMTTKRSFNSSIPEWLYFNKELEFVNFGTNHLQDAISSSIANLTSLHTLDLSNNQLSGKIPREIANSCKMRSLNLEGNQLYGHLTHQFGEFQSLQSLDLSWNSLSGVIPNNIGNLSSLESLYLDDNKLTGNVPESMGQLLNLKELYIENNMLEGVVTEAHFAHLAKLTVFLASRCHLTLKVGPNWTPPFKLTTLRLSSWNLCSRSQFPAWIETQKKDISNLDLSSTGICGNVPSWIWSISFLNLSHNQLHGKIPVVNDHEDTHADDNGMGQLVYLSSNNFSGPLPRIGYKVTELDLSDNSFTGDISHFLCDTTTNEETNQLAILHLGGNHLTGELSDCFMKWPSLRMLNLGNNNLSGTIPNSIGFLSTLRSLNLYGNKFSGHIPFSMQNCTQLLKLDLADNNLDGTLPAWIGTSLSKLKFLILRSNKLSGEITSSICQLSSLQILDLSDNKFYGIIPNCVDNFTAMATKSSHAKKDSYGQYHGGFGYSQFFGTFIESASIATKGSELTYDTILPLVASIDLSKNNLSGDIPNEITSLVGLKSLNLSGNQLTGMIPDSIGNMNQLESLDFSINSLSGEIPSSFTSMFSLSYLNLSCNNLTGRIPESTQFRGFNESSFIVNNLCGPPLTIPCSNEGKAPGPEDQDLDDDDKLGIAWLYVFVSLGYAVGLSPFFAVLILKREAYYEFLEDTWNNIYVYFLIKWRRLSGIGGIRTRATSCK